MKIKEFNFLKENGLEIEVSDPKLIPLVSYLLEDNNFFKTDKRIISETGFSRYLVKNARIIIKDFVEENIKLK